MTPQEVKVWNWLRQRLLPLGYRFRRQMPVAGYVVDFACLNPRIVIEIDGDGHAIGRGPARDRLRDEALRREGFVVMRFWNFEIDRCGNAVVDRILDALTSGASA
jgi:very-short-patch-repair endonuclease